MSESLDRLYEVMGTKTHTQIARELNVGSSTVTNWAKRGVSKEAALVAAQKFGSSANYILNGGLNDAHSLGVALYPPPEVGGFTATRDKRDYVNQNSQKQFLSI